MARNYFKIVVFVLSLVILASFSSAFAPLDKDKFIIKFKPGAVKKVIKASGVEVPTVTTASLKALNAKHKAVKIRQLYREALRIRPDWKHLENYYVIETPKQRNPKAVARDYKKDPNVISAKESSIVYAFDVTPNDPEFSKQYGLTNISAPQAWDRTKGTSEVIIAVLDTGIDTDHEDFSGRIDSRGKDFVNGDNNPEDDFGHGTAVSGVLGAVTNNGKGVAGVDWNAKILPIKVLDNAGRGFMSDILDGIQYANALGVDVMNMSFGQYSDDEDLMRDCQDAYDNGIVLIAAAGNGNVDWPAYPAYYSFVMAVAAVDSADKRSIWTGFDPETGKQQASNYGDWVDISAPGTSIWSTHMGGDYLGSNNGTSLACPFVSGLASLLKSVNPDLTNEQIVNKIMESADNIDSLNPGYAGKLGAGRINAYSVVSGLIARISTPEAGSYLKGSVDIYGTATAWDFSQYILEAYQGSSFVVTVETSTTSLESAKLATWDTTGLNGEYILRLKVLTATSASEEAEKSFYVDNTDPVASISSPLNGANINDGIAVTGSAKDQYFDYYTLEYGAGSAPTSYELIEKSYVAVDAGALASWETSGLEGVYGLRLRVYDKADRISSQTLSVNVLSVTPTREVGPVAGLPLTYTLPNPFDRTATSEVTFNYYLEGNFNTQIFLFDLSGNLLWRRNYITGTDGGKSGANSPSWDGNDFSGSNVPTGVYLYQVIAEQKVIARGKIVILN